MLPLTFRYEYKHEQTNSTVTSFVKLVVCACTYAVCMYAHAKFLCRSMNVIFSILGLERFKRLDRLYCVKQH